MGLMAGLFRRADVGMGFVRRALRSKGQDLIRLEILMEYSVPGSHKPDDPPGGTAAVRWSTFRPDVPANRFDDMRADLITLLYAEVLVIDAERRAELTARIDKAVERWGRSGSQSDRSPQRLEFDAWDITIPKLAPLFGSIRIWPWQIIEPKDFEWRLQQIPPTLRSSTIYTAILKAGLPDRLSPAGVWSFTEMPVEMGNVCVPSSPLIAAYAFGLEMLAARKPDPVTRLCALLDQVNRYYRTLGRFPLGGQAIAFAAALKAMKPLMEASQ